MKKRNKKAFTIVELVIVVAVIGVLAAILIPTFVNLTQKANTASDSSLVANLNKALKMTEADADAKDDDGNDISGKNYTMHDAVLDLEYQGYKFENLVTRSGEHLLYDLAENKFLLSADAKEAKNADYWQIVDAIPNTQKYNYYAGKKFADSTVNLSTGFDVGDRGSFVKEINYSNTTARTSVIRTDDATSILNIDALNDNVEHYGPVGKVLIEKIDFHCYYEYGSAAYVRLDQGKVVAKKGGMIDILFTTNSNPTAVAAIEDGGKINIGYTTGEAIDTANRENEGGIPLVYVVDETPITGEETIQEIIDEAMDAAAAADTDYWIDASADSFAGGSGTDLDPYLISSATQLARVAKVMNVVGSEYAGKVFKLTKNINLSGKIWTPIGYEVSAFAGTIDGNNKTIKGLSNYNENDSLTSLANDNNHAYGLVGVAALSKGDVTIKNLTLESVDIDITGGKGTGAVVGYLINESGIGTKKMFISNVTVESGSVVSNAHSGGIVGKNYGLTTEVDGCTNKATISGLNASGIVNYSSNGSQTVLINNCTNNGAITSSGDGSYASGIANLVTFSTATVSNCLNTGEIKDTHSSSITNVGGTIAVGSSGMLTIYNLENQGKVSTPNFGKPVGGIIGSVQCNLTIKAGYLKNSGEIIGNTVAGGIFGNATNGKTITIDLSNETETAKQKVEFINEGRVYVANVGTNSSGNHPYGAGAIFGYLGCNHSTFTNCIFKNQINSEIENSAVISAPEGSHTGLIAGSVSNAGFTFNNCSYSNDGTIASLESNMDLTTYSLSTLPSDANTNRIFGFIWADTGTTSFNN